MSAIAFDEHLAAVDVAPPDDLLRRYSAAELAALDRTFRWLACGLMSEPTYGMTAGEMKTLKTYVSIAVAVGVAAGVPVLGHFHVPEARPVMLYVGEGGQVPYTERLERVCDAYGVNLADLPLHATFETAPLLSDRFRDTLERDLADVEPGLVVLDPLYAFHGGATDSRNLHEEGALLTAISNPIAQAGACLDIVNHYNQTGSGPGLKRITMVGGGEWCDSWRLLSHRENPDVDNGRFRLTLEIGSRRWGGATWDLDLDVGRFDIDLGRHDGDINWHVTRHQPTDGEGRLDARILDILDDHPWELTKSQLVEKIGGNRDRGYDAVQRLEAAGKVRMRNLPRAEGKREMVRSLYGRFDQLAPDEEHVETPSEATA